MVFLPVNRKEKNCTKTAKGNFVSRLQSVLSELRGRVTPLIVLSVTPHPLDSAHVYLLGSQDDKF